MCGDGVEFSSYLACHLIVSYVRRKNIPGVCFDLEDWAEAGRTREIIDDASIPRVGVSKWWLWLGIERDMEMDAPDGMWQEAGVLAPPIDGVRQIGEQEGGPLGLRE